MGFAPRFPGVYADYSYKHHLEVKPEGIPRYPPREYEADFIDWPDWLGTSKSGSWQREDDPET